MCIFVYIILYLRYYLFKFPRDSTIYIEDRKVKELRNDDKLTLYENAFIQKFTGLKLKEKRLHRCFYSRCFKCDAPNNMELSVLVFSPEQTAFLYPNTHLFRLNQTSQVNVLNPQYEVYPKFKGAEYIEIPIIGGQYFVIPRGWWIFVDTPSLLLERKFNSF